MIDEKTLMKFKLTKDENSLKLKEVLKENAKFKEVYIDIYSENPLTSSYSAPFMLLLRTIEKNVVIENNEDRLILKRNDKFNTYLMNVLFSEIDECFCEVNDNCSEFILKIQNIYYRINVFN